MGQEFTVGDRPVSRSRRTGHRHGRVSERVYEKGLFCVAAAVPAAPDLGFRSGRDGRRYTERPLQTFSYTLSEMGSLLRLDFLSVSTSVFSVPLW